MDDEILLSCGTHNVRFFVIALSLVFVMNCIVSANVTASAMTKR